MKKNVQTSRRRAKDGNRAAPRRDRSGADESDPPRARGVSRRDPPRPRPDPPARGAAGARATSRRTSTPLPRAPFAVVDTPLDELKPHPRNYQRHPDDQLAQLEASLETFGFYRNVVAARDGTILAGHGVVEAARRKGLASVPVLRLEIEPDDPRARKVLVGDNAIGKSAEIDDRALVELLREIADAEGLDGTGFDEAQLAALDFVTRPPDLRGETGADEAWSGLPEYARTPDPIRLMVYFDSEEKRTELLRKIGAKIINKRVGSLVAIWYPERPKQDLASQRFEAGRKKR